MIHCSCAFEWLMFMPQFISHIEYWWYYWWHVNIDWCVLGWSSRSLDSSRRVTVKLAPYLPLVPFVALMDTTTLLRYFTLHSTSFNCIQISWTADKLIISIWSAVQLILIQLDLLHFFACSDFFVFCWVDLGNPKMSFIFAKSVLLIFKTKLNFCGWQ